MNTYTESQRMFDSTFNKIIILLVVALFGKILYSNISEGFQTSSILSLVLLPLCIILFVVFKVKTSISKESIQVKIVPFNLTNQTILWNETKKVEVVEYSAIKEYGGWGYRRSKTGKAINPSGKFGLKIYFKDGTHLLIGTRKPDELKEFLKSIKK